MYVNKACLVCPNVNQMLLSAKSYYQDSCPPNIVFIFGGRVQSHVFIPLWRAEVVHVFLYVCMTIPHFRQGRCVNLTLTKRVTVKIYCVCTFETRFIHAHFGQVFMCLRLGEWLNLREGEATKRWREGQTEKDREGQRGTEEADQLSGQRVAQKPNFTLH